MLSRHGGAFWKGLDGRAERLNEVVRADVLDAWFPPAPSVLQSLYKNLIPACNTSPELSADSLVEAISDIRAVPIESVQVGAGATSLIYSLLPRWLAGVEHAAVLDPTYSEYPSLLEHLGIASTYVPDWSSAATDSELLSASEAADAMLIVNPNNPTGSFRSPQLMKELARNTKLWIDETYIEYVPGAQSMETVAASTPNIVVVKSMSKAYALSGLRVGYVVAHPDTLRELSPLQQPWPIGLPAQIAAILALEARSYYEGCYRKTALYRHELASCIDALPTGINCVLVETGDPQALAEALERHAVYVRCPDRPSLHKYIRVAVRSLPENESLARAFASVNR